MIILFVFVIFLKHLLYLSHGSLTIILCASSSKSVGTALVVIAFNAIEHPVSSQTIACKSSDEVEDAIGLNVVGTFTHLKF